MLESTCSFKYPLMPSTNIGRTAEPTLLCPIPSMKSGLALNFSGTELISCSPCLKGTMLSLVPCMTSTGDLIEGAVASSLR